MKKDSMVFTFLFISIIIASSSFLPHGQAISSFQPTHETSLIMYAETSDADWWNLKMVNASSAWKYTLGNSDIVIAVIDTGILWSSEELPTSLRWENTAEINGTPGIDDDHNGYIDDFYGYDFSEAGYDNDPSTDQSGAILHPHGTMVTGIIAATHNDKIIAGIAPNVKIMNLRILNVNNQLFGITPIIDAFHYAMMMNATVINYSIYHNFDPPQELIDVYKETVEHGIPIVGVTGNDQGQERPGNLESIIAVGAVNSLKEVTQFSQKGEFVELVAPGDSVPTINGAGDLVFPWGTSFAAPHVTATLALMYSIRHDLSVQTMRNILHATADDIGEKGKDNASGYGVVNIGRAVYATKYYEKMDFDSDGLLTAKELALGTDPFNADTDGDGMPDGWEVTYGLNPLNSADKFLDLDGDGISNYEEYLQGSNPSVPESSTFEKYSMYLLGGSGIIVLLLMGIIVIKQKKLRI